MILTFESLKMFNINYSMSVEQEFETRNAEFQESALTALSSFVENYDERSTENIKQRSNSEFHRSSVAKMVNSNCKV